ncbi:glucose-6-phosphate isomerase [Candidatus Phytoplasma oryzae]|uniref:Glucose-6-phosphate isomerase n=1 Tax=Candidatus Phytoplasma oryzae TaxID=203274 RepID=A0A139JR65_9MOLU|nr:glucose-6-phosphate isomerase [Candidatus Phytoplasma oryzae]KXT29442.1 glucose-6-phosphate isomerase [Candidatus Phytoplasma oryzae]RAM58022.1 glucose-6-phosphate isomerase [Candidatus Phytoplasma oryzae]
MEKNFFFNLKINQINNFLDWKKESQKIIPKLKKLHNKIHHNQALKKKYLGWMDLPFQFNFQEIQKIKKIKKKLKELDILVVIGIGGSFLGTKAGIEFLKKPFNIKKQTEIIFAGYQMSGTYLNNLIQYLKQKNWAINVISKSGNTLETSLSFRILKNEIEYKYGKEQSKQRIFITTSNDEKSSLFNIANYEKYEKFIIPYNIGGRFSILTSVGILPFIFAGLKIEDIFKGAQKAFQDTIHEDIEKNFAYKYAIIRYLLHIKLQKKIELFVDYEPQLFYFSEWLKQLFTESEGKNNKGLFVGSLHNTTDLHSLGQFIQEGSKIMFETVLNVHSIQDDCLIPQNEQNFDNMNYLAGKYFSEINQKIIKSTQIAHVEGNVPNLEINFSCLNEYNFGYLIFFFQKACAISALLLDVNPFNQPGVEIYKKKMFILFNA